MSVNMECQGFCVGPEEPVVDLAVPQPVLKPDH